MGYTVDKKTGKIILVHDVTVTSKAVNQPETQQQQHQPAVDAALPAVPAAATTPPVSGTFVFPVTKQKVRTVWHEGNIWFVAKDVAECLAYTNPLKAVRDHCKGVNETFIPSAGGRQLIKIIPESDVYRLVMRSKLPAAEQFQTWVCEEVLPSIRKTGGYGRVAPLPLPPTPKPKISLSLRPCRYYCPEPKPSRRNWPKPNPRPIITTPLLTAAIFSRLPKPPSCSTCPPASSRRSCAKSHTNGCSRALTVRTSPCSRSLTRDICR